MKAVKRPENAAPKKVAKSMNYFIVYEHLYGGLVRKGNIVIGLSYKIRIEDQADIVSLQNHLRESLKLVEPIIVDFKELSIVNR